MDTFTQLHRNKFMSNWAFWKLAKTLSPAEGRAFQISHTRESMRYRAFQYAQARGWDIGWTVKAVK